MRTSSLLLAGGFVVSLVFVSSAQGANRFYINNQTMNLGSNDNDVRVLADLDQDAYGFSVSLQYDAAKLVVSSVSPGSAATALSPEYSFGVITSSPGRVSWGVVFDMSNPITKKLALGTNKEILLLKVNAKPAAAESSTVLDLINVPDPPPARINVITNATGQSVSPSLTDGTISLKPPPTPKPPVIDSFLNNSGCPGKQFLVVGQNFDQPGFRVNVCGVSAAATVIGVGGQQANVTAPSCGSTGWVTVEVCNDEGCDSELLGFNYDVNCNPVATFVRGNANNDASIDISDGIGILNDLFLGLPALAPCRDALDANDSGSVDISDGVYLLNFLFQGGLPIPPPYPTEGPDPTEDALPDC